MEFSLFLILLVCATAFSARTSSEKPLSPAQREISEFADKLFKADVNGLGKEIEINLQSKASRSSEDKAFKPLFTKVPVEKFSSLPTYAALLALYDNYETSVEKQEIVTSQELAEENRFLDEILKTDVMKMTHQFLVSKGKAPADQRKFRQYLKDIWFGLYSRAQGITGSSGFEHVFLGELKNGITGLHSWIQYSLEEKKGNMNYLGYIKIVTFGDDFLIELPIYWNNVFKAISSLMIGWSPELEIALYTTCFALQPNERCHIQHGGNSFVIQTHTINYKGKTFIGSAYPTLK